MAIELPIMAVIPALRHTLAGSMCAVLSAPPGAGKTTRVPLALLGEPWMQGLKIIMLEPRRLAARRAAEYMASLAGEKVGQSVGFRIRGESRVSEATRLEVVTEGVLTRMLHTSPELQGTGILIFDEFHERSIHADLGLALALDVQSNLRPDLRILVMSATLDSRGVAALLNEAPVIESTGRAFPVDTRWLASEGRLEVRVRDAVRLALADHEGDALVFLPGQREIRRTEECLLDSGLPGSVAIHLLYGEAASDRQQAALAPAAPGTRKVILSTSIAETSLTIEGVRIVVDAGLARVPRFDPRRGMGGLVTVPVSQASADQRRGRAGREGPGFCYRLWAEDQDLPRYSSPEILNADLAPLALDLALWGTPDGAGLRFQDPPPPAHLGRARDLLVQLGALDRAGTLTSHGRALALLPVHPRLAHMVMKGVDLGLGSEACDLAAMLEERDLLHGRPDTDVDLASRWQALRQGRGDGVRVRILAEARRLRSLSGVGGERGSPESLGVLLAMAYPERVARRRGDDAGHYQMAGGTGAVLPEWSALARERFLAVGEVDGVGTDVRIFLAAPLSEEEIRKTFADRLEVVEEVRWSSVDEAVVARRQTRLGALPLDERPVSSASDAAGDAGEAVRAAMIEGIRQLGLESLPWEKESLSLRARSNWLLSSGLAGVGWPDLSDRRLQETLDEWLAPFLNGITRRIQLARLDMLSVIRSRFSHRQLLDLDRLAPAFLTVPTGSRIRLSYDTGKPVLAVRLQEMFGQVETPLAGGIPVLIHLLSPAGRPLAITQDLQTFWRNAYPEVRKEMRGRYPKHPWPEDPLHAIPTRRTSKPGARR